MQSHTQIARRHLLRMVLATVLFLSHSVYAESIHCEGDLSGLSPQEKMICLDDGLKSADFKLAQLYSLALALSNSKSATKKSQQDWLNRSRSKCGDSACLAVAYERRINELITFIKVNSDPLPTKISGGNRHTEKVPTPYCKINGLPYYADTFTIDASVSDQLFNGSINGVFDCGRKIWDSSITGTIDGNIAFVEFDAGFTLHQTVRAIVSVVRHKLYWRVLDEYMVESYIPVSRIVRLSPSDND